MSLLNVHSACPCPISKSKKIIPLRLEQIRRNFGKINLQIYSFRQNNYFVSAKFCQNFGEIILSFGISFRRNISFFGGNPTPLPCSLSPPSHHFPLCPPPLPFFYPATFPSPFSFSPLSLIQFLEFSVSRNLTFFYKIEISPDITNFWPNFTIYESEILLTTLDGTRQIPILTKLVQDQATCG